MANNRLRQSALVLAGLLLCSLGMSGFAIAASGSGSAGRADDGDSSPGKLMLVFDSSGSMKQRSAGGETKIGAAKKALTTVIGQLPADQPVGLRVFGAKVFSANDPGACTDSQLKVPLATDNRQALRKAVATYTPFGETPIGYALQKTGQDLGTSGKRSIVLVSDGEPTCQPNPCEVAKKLAAQGIDLRIDVVGLDVNDKARQALECIAHAGHGVYYDVDNSKDFADSLIKVATRAARPYATIGQAVTGTGTAKDAPVISNGDWLDTTNGTKERYYTIQRTLQGSTMTFAAAFRDPNDTVFNTVSLSTPDGQICSTSGSVDPQASNVLISSAATVGPLDSSGAPAPETPCAKADTLIAKVTYSGSSTGVPVEIRVTELPAVKNVEQLPAQASSPTYVTPPQATPQTVQGGSSFDDAPTLQPGSYTGNIVQGETLTYQVKLDWGQQLNAQVTYPKLDGERAKAAQGTPVSTLAVFAPTRAPSASTNAGAGGTNRAILTQYGSTMATLSGPVRFRNTGASDAGIGGANDAGTYTITLFVDKKAGAASIPIPFTLAVGVSGSVQGEPEFDSTPVAPENATKSTGTSKASSDSAADVGSGGGGGFPTGPVLGGAGVLALLAALVVALRSRRTDTTP